MTTATQAFNDQQTTRLEAFADAVRHYPGVIGVNVDHRNEQAAVVFDGHKTACPMVVRDIGKALCLTLPDAGDRQFDGDNDDVQFSNEPHLGPRTKATFGLGDAIDRNQR
jgi:hypothetical protein